MLWRQELPGNDKTLLNGEGGLRAAFSLFVGLFHAQHQPIFELGEEFGPVGFPFADFKKGFMILAQADAEGFFEGGDDFPEVGGAVVEDA